MTRIVVVIASAVVGIGCFDDPEPDRVVDLTAALREARVVSETEHVVFADPAYLDLLGSGWLLLAEVPGKPGRAWGTGRRSEMVFIRQQPMDLTMTFRALPFRFEDRRRQKVSFFVNGQSVAERDLERGMQSVQIRVPVEFLRSGENHLVMEYAQSQSREEFNPKQGMDRAVLWEQMKIGPETLVGDSSPTADVNARRLFIPFGSRVDFHLDPLARGVLRVDRVDALGGAKGRLVVYSQSGEGDERVAAVLADGSGASELVIVDGEPGSIRLSLAAIGKSSATCDGPCGIILTGPVIAANDRPEPTRHTSMDVSGVAAGTQNRPNVVVYLIDALRADRLGCYGYDRPVSPRIDDFARDAVLFERAQAQTSWTRASVASIFTGLMAQVHSANGDDDALSPEVKTIAEFLKAAGYKTVGISTNGNAGPGVGFGQGFDKFKNLGPVRSEECNVEASKWLDRRDETAPFFMWVHTVDPHAPYMPPDDLRAVFAPDVVDENAGHVDRVEGLTRDPRRVTPQLIADLRALYDAEIAANDRTFGALIDDLQTRGLYDDALIILVADHGEEFFDHGGWTHGKTLFGEQLDIPMIIKYPGEGGGRRINEIVQHVDLLPTILRELGLAAPEGIQGRSLQVLLTEEGRAGWENRSFSSLDLRGRQGSSVCDGGWKVIRFRDRATGRLAMLFDKAVDPEETTDLFSVQPALGATMLALDQQLGFRLPEPLIPPVVDTSVKDKMRADLKALGYVQ